ncbi:MAG: hypothetical protein QF798_03120 [Candidatus Woesearchaeota archaeon]|jgi:CxxC-x17-CxxC domain-containing protein|nr:hypothetical protein [Candidatus Woesearchaeota archaeon]
MGDFNRNFDRRRSGRGRFDRPSGRFGGRGRDRGRSGRFGGRDRRSERHEMHSAICDKCGNDCEVPFRPTEGKPIYCDDCFKDKNKEAGSRSEMGKPINNEKFDKINKKLDRILRILEEPILEKDIDRPEVKPAKSAEKEEPDLEYAKSIERKKPKKKKAKKKKE